MKVDETQFQKVLKKSQSAEKIKRHLQQLEKQINTEYTLLDELANLLNKESKDYEALESMSLKSIFYKVLGSKEEQMEKERQEYLQASLKYDEAKKSIELMEYERKILTEKLDKMADVSKELKRMFAQREKFLVKNNGKEGKQLSSLTKELELNLRMIKEIREAIIAGENAQAVLEEIASYLKTAKNWGNWNTSGRRGMIQGYAKRTNMDKARAKVPHAKQALLRFENELRDIFQDYERLDFSLKLDSFSRFTDIFFDSLISDWVVQSRIQNAMASVHSSIDKVHRLVGSLAARIPQIKAQNKQIRTTKKNILKATK